MKIKNKLYALFVSAAMLLCGCSAGEAQSGSQSEPQAQTTEAEPPAPQVDYGEMRDIPVNDLVAEMTTGWNLGNTMDAKGGETAWGNPVTTHEMIDTVAQAGFNTIRIPTTWDQHFDDENDYQIDPEWMNRVHEIVNYAFDNDMYVILNCHHENAWIKPTMNDVESVLPKFTSMWKQIAESFEQYGDHLLFEGLNEPRVEGGQNEWSGGTPDGRQALNILNNAFVETVRATGGNNSTRALLITTFAAQVSEPTMKELEIPDDPNIIISLHAYTPYRYTYHNGETWEAFAYDDSVGRDIDQVFDLMDKYFISKNIPVIVTEYGAVSKIIDDSVFPAVRNDGENIKWVTHYLERAKQSGIPCVWWDNGYYYSGNELFGIFNRSDCTWYLPELVEAITNVYK